MRIYYQSNHDAPTVYVIFEADTLPDNVEVVEDVAKLTREGRLIGYNLFHLDLGRPFGMIPAPTKELDIINERLTKSGFEPISKPESSGYVIREIKTKEEHPLDERSSILTLDDGSSTVTRYPNVEPGKCIVVVTDGTMKFDGTTFNKKVVKNIPIDVEVCSPSDLRLSDDFKSAYLIVDKAPGEDFFA